MRKFKSEDFFIIKGRGKVFTMKITEDIPKNEVINSTVEIDGNLYRCIGIERFGNRLGDETLWQNEPVGLLVEELQ